MTDSESQALRPFRATFVRASIAMLAIAAVACATVHYLHRETTGATELVVSGIAIFVLLPGALRLLYLRFRREFLVRYRAEQSAQAEAARRALALQHMMEALLDPILAIDERGTVLTTNPAVERVFGWTPDELLGRNINVLMGEPYRAEHDGYLRHYLATGEAKAIGKIRKVTGRRRNGEDFPCELSVSEIGEHDARRFVGVVRDISDREALAARLAQAERLVAVGELAAGVAHEVNNPVNTIINCAQLLKDGEEDPQLTDDIIDEGMRIASIVRDLLDFSRDRREDPAPVTLADVVHRTLSLVSRRFDKRGIALTVDVPADLPEVRARFQQLQQVLLNLLLNARDALIADPRAHTKEIHVAGRSAGSGPDRHICLTVEDNGPGIPAENLDKVFRPFFTTKASGGNGLGLAVSLDIVRDHGGTLTVDNDPGSGCTFRLCLPAADAVADPAPAVAAD